MHWCLGKCIFLNFANFSCEPLFVLLMQYIFRRIRKNDAMIALAYANVDSEMTDPKPPDEDTKQFQEWNTSNRVCVMTLKRVIPEVYQGKLENISTR